MQLKSFFDYEEHFYRTSVLSLVLLFLLLIGLDYGDELLKEYYRERLYNELPLCAPQIETLPQTYPLYEQPELKRF